MEINLNEHFTCKKILRYALPNIGTMLAITSFQMIDGYFVSNFLGVMSFAAVNLVFPLVMIFAAPGFMIGSGGSAIISKTKGEGNISKAREYFTMLVAALLTGGIFFGVTMYFFLPEILKLIGASDELIPYCLEFGQIVFLFLPCLLTSTAFQSLWIAAEKPVNGFRLALLQGLVIVIFDWLLIVQFGFGIEGAAAATVLGSLTFTLITLSYFMRPNESGMYFVKFRFSPKKFLGICYNGSSEMIDAVSINIVELVLNLRLMQLIGEIAVAAFGVYAYVNEIFLSVFFAISTTTVTLVGYNYGRKNFVEIKSLRRNNVILTLSLGVILTAAAFLLSDEIAAFYLGYDPASYELTIKVLRTCSLMFLLYGFNIFVSAYFTGLEKSSLSACVAFLQSLIMPVTFILILPEIFGANAIWFSLPVATLMTAFVAAFFLTKKSAP